MQLFLYPGVKNSGPGNRPGWTRRENTGCPDGEMNSKTLVRFRVRRRLLVLHEWSGETEADVQRKQLSADAQFPRSHDFSGRMLEYGEVGFWASERVPV